MVIVLTLLLMLSRAARLMELAHSLEEMKTICRCGRKAMFNARKVNGEWVREGSQLLLMDNRLSMSHCAVTATSSLSVGFD